MLSEEVLENNHKRLRDAARDRLRQMLGHLFECEHQLEGHINQEYDALKKKMEKRKKFIKYIKTDAAIITCTAAALIVGVLKYGLVGVKK